MSYGYDFAVAAHAPASERAAFIRRTYGHLAGAVLAFAILETLLLQVPGIEELVGAMLSGGIAWLVVLAAFMGVGFIARSWARSSVSLRTQYAGLALYIFAQALIFLPLLYIAKMWYPQVIPVAAVLTGAVFGGLTLVVFITRKDYSYLRPIVVVGCWGAFALIVASSIFGFSLGLVFCYAMVALICGSILYRTSAVLHDYRTDQHVAAALELFASVAILFWYIVQILMLSRD